MAYANASAGYGYHPASAHGAISRRRPSYPYEADDDSAILDSAILDHADIMQSPADAQPRKGSFAPANGLFTPVESQGWNPAYGGLPVEPSSAHPFHDDRNGFAGRAPLHVSTFVPQPQPASWGYEHRSGHCTPTNGADLDYMQQAPPGYERAQYIHHRNDSARGSFNHGPPSSPHVHPPQHFNNPRPDGTFAPAPQVQTPMSPHSNQDWMAMAQQEVENRMPKRMRTCSPGQTSVDMQRRDGIRKKNGRIEIPQERNSATIDALIEKAEDEELLKELKQQKRLLRNREAALASRQRKKKHTEDLESKEKVFQAQLHQLQAHIEDLGQQLRERQHNLNVLVDRLRAVERENEILEQEKRDMIMRHAEESGTLRKRVQLLTEQLEAGPAPGMSAQPSSAGFNDFTGDMEALNMGTHEWDNLDIFGEFNSNITDEFAFDTNPEAASPSLLDKRSTPTALTIASEKKPTESSADPPIASGLLFFLLLCGAFVASKPASSRPSYIPQVPEDVRAAAPALINNLLSDSGSTPSAQQRPHAGRPAMEPAQSGLPQTTRPRGRLDQVHQRITSPTKEQEAATAFSLTTQQYASISGMDYLSQNEQPGPNTRHNTPTGHRLVLAETLAKMEDERARNHKADVYTRSLLWDQIPADVLRQFREMARDHNELETRQTQMTHDDMEPFKVEQG